MSAELTVRLEVNGAPRAACVPAERLLLDFLRDDLGLTGTRAGCRNGLCGSCTVHLDGTAVRACLVLAAQADGRSVRTVEGLATLSPVVTEGMRPHPRPLSQGERGVATAGSLSQRERAGGEGHPAGGEGLHPLQRAFVEYGAVQCGYCIPGMLMTATALLAETPRPDEAAIRAALEGNLCRCTGYAKIVAAVAATARALAGEAAPAAALANGPGAAVGQSVPRADAVEKVTGSAAYLGELALPGLLHARLLRSPHAHAQVVRVDTARAEALDGVVAVLTRHNAPRRAYTDSDTDVLHLGAGPPLLDQVLFDDMVRYVGEPVAAVAATSDAVALAALQLIEVEYAALPAVFEAEAALAPGAPALHAHAPDNVAARVARAEGDVEAALAAADLVVEGTFRTSRQKHGQLEPYGCLAQWDPSGKLTVWSPTQTPHPVRLKLAALFELPESAVRVVNPHIGGAFGGGLGFVHEPLCAALAMAAGRPVRLLLERGEDFLARSSRHPMTIHARLGLRDGRAAAIDVRTVANTGAYLTQGRDVVGAHGGQFNRLYPFPAARFEGLVVYTNAPVAGGFRGYGGPQAYFALEQLLDEAAERLGEDPLDLRLRLAIPPDTLDAKSGRRVASHGLAECIARGKAAIGWETRRARGAGRGPRRRGVGAALVMWSSGTACSPHTLDASGAVVQLNVDGTVQLLTGISDMGTGAKTALRQVVADSLGVPVGWVAVGATDTDSTPFDVGAHASRTLYVAGSAAQAAAVDVRRQVLAHAAELLEAHTDDLELVGGVVQVRGAPERGLPLGRVTRDAYLRARQFIGSGQFTAINDPPFGAQFAAVEVDTETGVVDVLRLVAAHDVGRAINPRIVEGQLEGALQQGLGWALYEDYPLDPETGTPQATTFASYRMPAALSMPPSEVILVEAPGAAGPFGAKGVGEPGLVPTAAAIANAIHDAVGVRLRELPMTPERVLAALRASHTPAGATA